MFSDYVWCLCNVSTWLGWTSFPRVSFTVCFQLKWIMKEIAEWSTSHSVIQPCCYLSPGSSLQGEAASRPAISASSSGSFFSFNSWAWCQRPSAFAGHQCLQGQRHQELTWIPISSHGLWLMLVAYSWSSLSLTSHPSSLLHFLPCSFSVPVSNTKEKEVA